MWVIIVTITVLFTIVYDGICRLCESQRDGVLDCLNVAFAVAVNKLPQASSLRIFLTIWCVYCLHVQIFYVTQLIRILQTPTTETQIVNVDQLIASKVPFGFPTNFKLHFDKMNTTQSKHILQHNQNCASEACLENMRSGKFATVGNSMFLRYGVAFEGKNISFYTLRVPVAKSFVEALMIKGFPLRDKINSKIRRMVELGYLAVSQRIYDKITANRSLYHDNGGRQFEHLHKEHFDGAFLILGVGFCAALCVFLIENLVFRQRQRQN